MGLLVRIVTQNDRLAHIVICVPIIQMVTANLEVLLLLFCTIYVAFEVVCDCFPKLVS